MRPQGTMPAAERVCRRRLRALGAVFEEVGSKRDAAAGCSLSYPLRLKSLGAAISLTPDAVLNCAMAEATVRFARNVVAPAASAELGVKLTGIDHASAYVCRPRRNGAKLSEHAFGNAVDIARFLLADGTAIEVRGAPPRKQEKFLDRIRKAACGPFRTVLGPGSDPDHETHLHLDLQPRRNGATFCQ